MNELGGTGAELSVMHVRLSHSLVFAKLNVRKETRNIYRRKVTPMNGISARQTLARGCLDLFFHSSILSMFLLALVGCGSQEHGMLATSVHVSACSAGAAQQGALPMDFYSIHMVSETTG